jgi:hypothetical protein
MLHKVAMDPDSQLAKRWRSRAEQYRIFAGETESCRARATLIRLSMSYVDLAEAAEKRAGLKWAGIAASS